MKTEEQKNTCNKLRQMQILQGKILLTICIAFNSEEDGKYNLQVYSFQNP